MQYKKTWVHDFVKGHRIHSDGTWGHLMVEKTGKQHEDSCYHPRELDELLKKLSPQYRSKLSQEDKERCSVDISLETTKISMSEVGDEDEFTKSIKRFSGVPKYQGYSSFGEFTRELCIDGMGSYETPEDVIKKVSEKELADFVRFHFTLSRLNGKYQPSNYGSQEQDFPLHYDMLKCYRNVIKEKTFAKINSGWGDSEQDFLDTMNAEEMADNRDDQLLQVLPK